MTTGILALATLLAAPTSQPPRLTQRDVDKIVAQCKLPPGWLVLQEVGVVRLQPAPDGKFEKVECALAKLQRHGLTMGFVGNGPAE